MDVKLKTFPMKKAIFALVATMMTTETAAVGLEWFPQAPVAPSRPGSPSKPSSPAYPAKPSFDLSKPEAE